MDSLHHLLSSILLFSICRSFFYSSYLAMVTDEVSVVRSIFHIISDSLDCKIIQKKGKRSELIILQTKNRLYQQKKS